MTLIGSTVVAAAAAGHRTFLLADEPGLGKTAEALLAGRRREVHPRFPVRAEGVVAPALLLVGQDLVGLVDLLEALLGGLVLRIEVRVELACELPVRLFDLVGRRVPGDAKRLVVVAKLDGHPLTLHSCGFDFNPDRA